MRRVHLWPTRREPPTGRGSLRDELCGLHSARRGDYRVIYAIVEDTRVIKIVHIDRRSDVYR